MPLGDVLAIAMTGAFASAARRVLAGSTGSTGSTGSIGSTGSTGSQEDNGAGPSVAVIVVLVAFVLLVAVPLLCWVVTAIISRQALRRCLRAGSVPAVQLVFWNSEWCLAAGDATAGWDAASSSNN